VLGVMLLIAIPAAYLIGAPIVLLAAGLLGPLSFILGPIGFVFGKIIEFVFLLLTPFIDLLQGLLGRRPPDQPPANPGQGPLVPPEVQNGDQSMLAFVVALIVVALILAGLFYLVLRLTYRPRTRDEAAPEAPLEEREFRLPTLRFRRPHLGLPARHPRPTTASGAYLAFLADLQGAPDLARRPEEPPATHAARLRAAGFGDRRAGLLAADYQLERYALRDLPPRETARAVRRWEALRERIRALGRRHTDAPDSPG
jgi:hypothetical protein